jgi:hypothetical protein
MWNQPIVDGKSQRTAADSRSFAHRTSEIANMRVEDKVLYRRTTPGTGNRVEE